MAMLVRYLYSYCSHLEQWNKCNFFLLTASFSLYHPSLHLSLPIYLPLHPSPPPPPFPYNRSQFMLTAHSQGQGYDADAPVTTFDEMNLHPELLHGVYGFGFEKPSVIQQRAIIPLAQGYDVIAQSQSGTGKTGAFAIGLLQRVEHSLRHTQVLVMEPTRELAVQSADIIRSIATHLDVVVHSAIGGTAVGKDAALLRSGVHVLVGTPGRVRDLIRRGLLNLDHLKLVVLDEADEMLSEGFLEAVRELFNDIPPSTQVGLFSATLPPDVLELTERFMKDPKRITLKKDEVNLAGIRQYYVDVERDENKLDVLLDLYDRLSVSQSVVFVNTRRRVDMLARALDSKDFTVSCIHSELPPQERNRVMEEFRVGRSRILIATDIVARGIDVGGVGFVVNFDLTRNFENYIHRVGRCGRFGRKGLAINLVCRNEFGLLRELQAFYGIEIPELTSEFSL